MDDSKESSVLSSLGEPKEHEGQIGDHRRDAGLRRLTFAASVALVLLVGGVTGEWFYVARQANGSAAVLERERQIAIDQRGAYDKMRAVLQAQGEQLAMFEHGPCDSRPPGIGPDKRVRFRPASPSLPIDSPPAPLASEGGAFAPRCAAHRDSLDAAQGARGRCGRRDAVIATISPLAREGGRGGVNRAPPRKQSGQVWVRTPQRVWTGISRGCDRNVRRSGFAGTATLLDPTGSRGRSRAQASHSSAPGDHQAPGRPDRERRGGLHAFPGSALRPATVVPPARGLARRLARVEAQGLHSNAASSAPTPHTPLQQSAFAVQRLKVAGAWPEQAQTPPEQRPLQHSSS